MLCNVIVRSLFEMLGLFLVLKSKGVHVSTFIQFLFFFLGLFVFSDINEY